MFLHQVRRVGNVLRTLVRVARANTGVENPKQVERIQIKCGVYKSDCHWACSGDPSVHESVCLMPRSREYARRQ